MPGRTRDARPIWLRGGAEKWCRIVPFGAAKISEGEVGFLLRQHVGVLPERQFGVAVPKLPGDPPQAFSGGEGAGSIGMSRAVEPKRSHPLGVSLSPNSFPYSNITPEPSLNVLCSTPIR